MKKGGGLAILIKQSIPAYVWSRPTHGANPAIEEILETSLANTEILWVIFEGHGNRTRVWTVYLAVDQSQGDTWNEVVEM